MSEADAGKKLLQTTGTLLVIVGASGVGKDSLIAHARREFSGNASVLFTFYPPLTATPWFYIGLVLVVVASWVWCLIMIFAMRG